MNSGPVNVNIYIASFIFVMIALVAMIFVPVFASPEAAQTISRPLLPESAGGMFDVKK